MIIENITDRQVCKIRPGYHNFEFWVLKLKIIKQGKRIDFIVFSYGEENMNHVMVRPIDKFNLIHNILCKRPVTGPRELEASF